MKALMGPHARIVGIDIVPKCAPFAKDEINVRIVDQTNKAFFAQMVAEFGLFDVVIDNGSYLMAHVNLPFMHSIPASAEIVSIWWRICILLLGGI